MAEESLIKPGDRPSFDQSPSYSCHQDRVRPALQRADHIIMSPSHCVTFSSLGRLAANAPVELAAAAFCLCCCTRVYTHKYVPVDASIHVI